jgi:hypothetical protein
MLKNASGYYIHFNTPSFKHLLWSPEVLKSVGQWRGQEAATLNRHPGSLVYMGVVLRRVCFKLSTFSLNESPIPTHEHKQVGEMRRLILLSRGKWDPVFASKKRYLEFEQRGRRKAVDDIFLKVRHMYLGLLERPSECDSRWGNGPWYELAPLNRAALNGAWPLTEPPAPISQRFEHVE